MSTIKTTNRRSIEKTRTLRAAVLAGIAVLSVAGAQATTYSQYAIYQLPTINGGTYSSVDALNEDGTCVGYGDIAGGNFRGVIWNLSYTQLVTASSLTTISPGVGGNNSRCTGINNLGEVVGFRDQYNSSINQQMDIGFYYKIGQTIHQVPNFAASALFECNPWDINDSGVITGQANGVGNSSLYKGFKYDKNAQNPTLVNIGVLFGGSAGESKSYAINSFGTVVGFSKDSNWENRAIRANNSLQSLGGYTPLIFEPAQQTIATCLNASVTVGGYAQEDFNTFRAIYRTAFMAIGDWNGVPLLTGVGSNPSDDSNTISGVNDSGDFVGDSEIGNANHYAFLYRNNGGNGYSLHNLNSFLPANSGWVLKFAKDINNRGWIVGDGTYNGQNRAYVLYPYSILSGTVSAIGWTGTLAGRTLSYTIRDQATNTVLQQGTTGVGSGGTYSISTTWCKNVVLSIDVSGPFLRKATSINATNNQTVNVALFSGDGDNDEEITNSDYSVWAAGNGQNVFPGTNGDYDGDGEVTNADYALWASNNGILGDE